jgi:hypothetical protein
MRRFAEQSLLAQPVLPMKAHSTVVTVWQEVLKILLRALLLLQVVAWLSLLLFALQQQ